MIENAKTTEEMRKARPETPDTLESLMEYIREFVGRSHDYNTCVDAVSLCSYATFKYVASQLGITGFQASCADMDLLRRTRIIKGPFGLIMAHDMLYPQCDPRRKFNEFMEEWKGWAAEEAKKLIATADQETVHPDVLAHWRKVASCD